ncbi:MAG: hypothetical protein K0S47_1088 [Herbinix sp.]|jgi:hypothetical protein|nr:hypothetical protein [Herbinix sp.]
MNMISITLERFIQKEEEGTYFLLPFEVPEEVERMDISYEYVRFATCQRVDGSILQEEINIVDLGLNGPSGTYIGSSGADRSNIYITSDKSSQGFAPQDTKAGEWSIIVGAYKIQEGGLFVTYHITFTKKELRLLKGDTHMHTLGSDGTYSVAGIAQLGHKLGLDYIIITDHNNYAHNFQTVDTEGITVIPGTEWTHYKGHAGIWGVKKPFENAFCVNSLAEVKEKLSEAKGNGAMIVLNHPFCPNCGWKWGIENVEYDAVEIWNGGLPISYNISCMEWWEEQLRKGRKIPVVGGSDFHRHDVASLVGMPSTCVYAMSNTKEDIIEALRQGHSYITMSAKGPDLSVTCGDRILGDIIEAGDEIKIHFWDLHQQDKICLITDTGMEEILCEPGLREIELIRKYDNVKYCRFEVHRILAPGLPPMKILLSNPIYYDK